MSSSSCSPTSFDKTKVEIGDLLCVGQRAADDDGKPKITLARQHADGGAAAAHNDDDETSAQPCNWKKTRRARAEIDFSESFQL